MRITIVFDVETNGLPKNYKASPMDTNNWPRVIQLAWCVYADGIEMKSDNYIIKPAGWTIPSEIEDLTGITNEEAESTGVPIKEAIEALLSDINQCDEMVAHNIGFDFPIVACEMIRLSLRAERRPEKICTMQSTVDLVKIPRRGGYKWPKLQELHNKLFGESFDNAHNALADVRATGKCYFELKSEYPDLKWWKL